MFSKFPRACVGRRGALPRFSLFIPALGLSGCAAIIDRPDALADANGTENVTYAAALGYLNATQTKLTTAYTNAVGYDNAERFSVGGGVAGAGVSAVFHAPTGTILGLMSFAGLGYTVNQTTRPLTAADAYSRGIKNLDCIRDAAHNANRTLAELTREEGQLKSVVAALQSDAAIAAPDPTKKVAIEQAQTAVAAANLLIVSIDSYVGDSDVPEAMYDGVNRTINAVNEQIRSTQPDIDAIAKSGSILTSFFDGHSALASQAQSSADAMLKASSTVAHGDADALQKRMDSEIAMVNALIGAIKRTIPSTDVSPSSAVSACQVKFSVISLSPSGPVSITAGGNVFSLRATGGNVAALQFVFSGETPATADFPAPQVDPSTGVFTISVPAKSPVHEYSFYVHAKDASAGDSATVKLTVAAAPAPAPAESSAQQGSVKTPPKKAKAVDHAASAASAAAGASAASGGQQGGKPTPVKPTPPSAGGSTAGRQDGNPGGAGASSASPFPPSPPRKAQSSPR